MFRGALAAVLLLSMGCRGSARLPQRPLVVAMPSGPDSLFPNTANEEFSLWVAVNVYETLVDLDAGLGLRPGLAESWHTPDDMTWTFRLREGVRLHDGRILEASHVAASLEHARSDPASRRQAQLAFVRSIQALDPRTVVIRTQQPFDPLPVRLSTIFIWGRTGEELPAGTGPYRVRSWARGGGAVLEAFAGHRNGPPPIPTVEFRVAPDPGERLRLLKSGAVHLLADVPAEEMTVLSGSPGLRTAVRNGLRVFFLGMDCARERNAAFPSGPNPFRDRRVREAVALAIDRPGLVRGPLGGFAEVVDQIASPEELGGYRGILPERPPDPARARRLLAAAGYASGFTVPLDYMPKYRAIDAVVRAVAKDLGGIGIRVVPRAVPPGEFMPRLEMRQLAFYIIGWISDTGDGRVSYEYLLHSPGRGFGLDNGSGYSDPETDRLIEAAARRLGRLERQELFTRLAEKVYADLPVVPLYRQADLYAMARRLAFTPRLDRRIRAAEIRWEAGK